MLVTVARYSFPWEAQINRARLEAEGIPAFVADEQTINMQWLYSDALGGVRLQVPSACEERARELLSEDRSADLETSQGSDVPLCPLCCAEMQSERRGRRWAFLVFLGIDFPLFPTRKILRCGRCGYEQPS